MRIEDIKKELEVHYKSWKAAEKTLENNECFSEDRNYFKNCEIFHSTNFQDLYNDYTKSFKQYIFSGNIIFILYRLIYWHKYEKIRKELKKFYLYLKIKYD